MPFEIPVIDRNDEAENATETHTPSRKGLVPHHGHGKEGKAHSEMKGGSVKNRPPFQGHAGGRRRSEMNVIIRMPYAS
jgi:hypothetical protein